VLLGLGSGRSSRGDLGAEEVAGGDVDEAELVMRGGGGGVGVEFFFSSGGFCLFDKVKIHFVF